MGDDNIFNDANIEKYIKQIVDALEPVNNQDIINNLNEEVKNYTNREKLSFINDTQKHLNTLIEADKKIEILKVTMANKGGYDPDNWNKLMEGLSKLQVLSLINKTANCKETTDAIITALNEKINRVNEVLVKNLQTGGNIKSYKHKYLKYKSKYLRIKNNM